jgi:hypothetical protein
MVNGRKNDGKEKLLTIDYSFNNKKLNSSVEDARKVLDGLENDKKIKGYYLMRYVKRGVLGAKIILTNSRLETDVIDSLKKKLGEGKKIGYLGDVKIDARLASIGMKSRNLIFDLLTSEKKSIQQIPLQLLSNYFLHYIFNPLLLGYLHEAQIGHNLVVNYFNSLSSAKIELEKENQKLKKEVEKLKSEKK